MDAQRRRGVLLRRQRASALVSLRGFRVALPRAQRIRNQLPRRSLRLAIPSGERQRLVTHAVRLTVVTRGVTHATELDPQQRIVRLDAHRALDGGGRESEVATAHLLV